MKFIASIAVTLLISVNSLFSQETKNEWKRANWLTGYSFGIPDGATKNYFGNMQSLKVQKNFNVGKPITLSVLGSIGNAKSKVSTNINFVSLGGGVALYPIYFVNIISGKDYDADKDNLHIDFAFQTLLNRTDFEYLYNIDLNLYTFKYKKNQSLSGHVSYNMLLADDEINKNPAYKNLKFNSPGFFALGITYGF